MEPSYNVFADWLSKFHTWPESIQALWLIVVPVTVLGTTWLVMRGLRDMVAPWRGEPHRRLVYGVIEDAEGRLLVWRDGKVRVVEGPDPHAARAGFPRKGPAMRVEGARSNKIVRLTTAAQKSSCHGRPHRHTEKLLGIPCRAEA